jgi:hypothetical protein
MKSISVPAIIFVVFFISDARSSKGQIHVYNIPESISTIKNCKLQIVELWEEKQVINKLEKKHPEQLQAYKDFVANTNQSMKEAAESTWPFTDNIAYFSTYDEWWKFRDDSKTPDALIRFSVYPLQDRVHVFKSYSFIWPIDSGQFVNRLELADENGLIMGYIDHRGHGGEPLYGIGLPHKMPTRADWTFFFQYLAWLINHPANDQIPNKEPAKASLRNAKKLPDQTLLINSADLGPQFDSSSIKSFYKYPYQLLSPERFDSIVSAKVPGFCYLAIAPFGDDAITNYNVIVLSTEGEPMAFVSKSFTNNNVNKEVLGKIMESIDESKHSK